MSDLNHRAGVREATLVVRHLKLENLAPTQKQALLDDIDHAYGVDSVSLDENSQVLNVAYDATHCRLDGIERLIERHGATVGHDWWTRFKEGYYRYIDGNIRENVSVDPHRSH